MKINTLVNRLHKIQAQLAAAEQTRLKELRGLPQRHGFSSTDDFIRAIRQANGSGRGRGRPPRTTDTRKRRRARITDEMRAEVKKLVEAGQIGSKIAKTVGISLPSVQNIKKAFGLVKAKRK